MLQNIRLQHFRSYDDASFELVPGVNIIVGPNASGKTNLLEAILVLAHGSSFRAHDTELVALGKDWARLDAFVDGTERIVKLVREPKPEKSYDIGGRVYRRLSMQDELPVVLFEPNHLQLLSGPPEERRSYLDELLAQMVIGYGTVIRDYRRVLAQRNRLLKSHRTLTEQLFPWNVRLSELGARIARQRLQLTELIDSRAGELYRDLARSDTAVAVRYRIAAQSEQYESTMLQQLEQRLPDDINRGYTSFGPHREDFEVLFNGHPAADVASRGEIRTFVLGAKIIELDILEERRGQKPLVLLDDVFSELDAARRRALTAHLNDYQTFITTTDADIIARHFAEGSNVIPIAITV